jgi:hypothetical protein
LCLTSVLFADMNALVRHGSRTSADIKDTLSLVANICKLVLTPE